MTTAKYAGSGTGNKYHCVGAYSDTNADEMYTFVQNNEDFYYMKVNFATPAFYVTKMNYLSCAHASSFAYSAIFRSTTSVFIAGQA